MLFEPRVNDPRLIDVYLSEDDDQGAYVGIIWLKKDEWVFNQFDAGVDLTAQALEVIVAALRDQEIPNA